MRHMTPHPALAPRHAEICQLVGNYRGKLPSGDWAAALKVDGWRAVYCPLVQRKTLHTRNGIPIEGIGHILHKLEAMERHAGEPLIFDGEFQVGGTLAATKAWCEAGWKAGGEDGTYHLFDCLTLSEWLDGGSDRPWIERQRVMRQLYTAVEGLSEEWEWRAGTKGKEPDGPHVTILSAEYVADHGEVMDLAQKVWDVDGEGLVLKRIDSPYRRNRSNDWLKVKKEGVR